MNKEEVGQVTEKTTIPDGAKKPQDHKKKDEPSDVRTVVVRGTELSIPSAALDDFELLDDLNEIDQNRNAVRMASVLRRLVGDQWRTVMDLARDEETGRVSIEGGAALVQEIMQALNPNS